MIFKSNNDFNIGDETNVKSNNLDFCIYILYIYIYYIYIYIYIDKQQVIENYLTRKDVTRGIPVYKE